MPSWQKQYAPVSCRCCGATKARRGNAFGICGDCEEAVYRRHDEVSAETVELYLISRLKSAVKRMRAGKPAVRCEAISVYPTHQGRAGFQCGAVAATQRDGKWVCTAHANCEHVAFTASPRMTNEGLVAGLVAQLSANPDMRKAIRDVMK